MGRETAIQWTDATWNPWYGCTKVSPGCAHCYMFREAKQYGRDPEAVTRSKTKFTEPLRWERELVAQARGAAITPKRVFTCSWSDWFHEAADAWRDEAWAIVRQTPHLTYQILTKRPERIAEHLPSDWGEGYPNVWLGVSAEYQRQAEERIPLLLGAPAAVHFVSAEPLLGHLDLRDWITHDPFVLLHHAGLDALSAPRPRTVGWVIVGGESGGHEARPFNPAWAQSLVDQGRANDASVFVKQLGSVWAREHHARDWHGGDWSEWPDELRVREFPQARGR